ncbi:MAG: bifunctional methylenetetrahydrofolate dehydrogenase/methenyltetrahydrofolate cyclohydrolase FolD [Kiritimatiellae bacterium]|jgi:methylenetetrahydrofolate dehydrogenase (NADP+)/methenyltetrahydrofolate cyclohydrolase|nr:bifunctional methylenetetrahydrofolate dehydrogenase/methenyltetrahydrofolate cyclohydrolase FolD [Kiritimatiellia bacterium]
MIIDGLEISAAIRAECAAAAAHLAAVGTPPGLAVILVGENPASVSYVTAKERACKETGIRSFALRLPADVPQSRLLAEIRRLNGDRAVHGILVQLPLPKHIDESEVIRAIAPEKDVDGFHPVSLGKLLLGEDTFVSCTPAGILEMLKRSGVETAGRHVVVVGRSNIVGKPVANLLLQKRANATVTVCHTGTPDLGRFTRQADILVVAAGRPGTVTADMVKPGAVVIDVGVNRVPDASKKSGFRLVGDVDFDGVAAVASRITPVPGGVGPMTIAMLLSNTVKSARQAAGL